MEGLQMIPIDTIISCESDDNYTNLQLKEQEKDPCYPFIKRNGRDAGAALLYPCTSF